MSITKLDQIVELVKTKPRKRLVAANANDTQEHTNTTQPYILECVIPLEISSMAHSTFIGKPHNLNL